MTGEDVRKLRDALKALHNPLITHHDELARLFMPFRLIEGDVAVLDAESVFDSTARNAATVLANGLASLLFPREEEWFELLPPRALEDDDAAVSAYREASPIMRAEMEASNFPEEAQECVMESPVFGTTAMFVGDMDEETGELYYYNQPIGTYYIGEDHRKRVSSLVREMDLTADQAAAEFGEADLPEEVRSKVGTGEGASQCFKFVQAVRRNPKPNEKSRDGYESARWQSCVIFEKTREVVHKKGFGEFPFAVHRYRRVGRSVWGFGPGTLALGDARQLNFLNELADAATEKDVFPPMVADAEMEGEVDQGPLGMAWAESAEQASMLKEFGRPGGKYSAFERIQHKEAALERAFHVDLFRLFSQRVMERGPLTATEASLVAGEKLAQFSPTYGRLVSEFLDPILKRTFMVLWRAGKFSGIDWPASVKKVVDGQERGVAEPVVGYKNKIVLAMKARENGKLVEFLEVLAPLMQMVPGAMDALEPGVMLRDGARNAGLPEKWVARKEVFEERQRMRAEAAQRQAQLEDAEQAGRAVGAFGKAPAEVRQQVLQGGFGQG